jgi:hypothetical protein
VYVGIGTREGIGESVKLGFPCPKNSTAFVVENNYTHLKREGSAVAAANGDGDKPPAPW